MNIKQTLRQYQTLSFLQVSTFGAGAFKFLMFDLIWGLGTSFSGMGFVATWVNMLLFGLLFSMPYIAFRSRWAQIVVFFLLDALLVSNLMYRRTYFGLIPVESYLLVGNLADFTASVRDSMKIYDLFFPLSTIALWLLYWFLPRFRAQKTNMRARGYWLALFFLFALSCCVTVAHGGFRASHEKLSNANYHSAIVQNSTVFGTIVYDLLTKSEPLTQDQKKEVKDFIDNAPVLVQLPQTRQNLVWILCESLESWVIGAEAEGKPVAPYLTSLAQDSTTLYLPHVLSQVADGRSIDSQLITNAGLLPLKSGSYSIVCPDNRFMTIAKAMKEDREARSYLFTVDKANTWNQQAVAKSFGIDTLVERSCWVVDQKVGPRGRLGDESFMKQLARKCGSGEVWPAGQPAFVQVVTYSGHNPFILPAEYDKLKLQGDYPPLMREYMTMAHFTDRSLKNFIDYLKTRPDYANTLIVITGDHEGLADRRASMSADSRSLGLVSKEPYVPILILNAPQAGRYDKVVGQIDLYPTLLQMLGLTSYPWHGVGHSLLSPETKMALSPQGTLVGDTTDISSPFVSHTRDARVISDRILRHDMLKKLP